MPDVWRVGLTGGIGSGKSTVAGLMHQQGATIVDADAISRLVTQAGGSAIDPLRNAFGSEFIDSNGALDREKMRNLVYSNPLARHKLESIVHPLVSQETARQANVAINAGSNLVVFDIPLLVESNKWRSKLDLVIVVDCEPDIQIARVVARSGLTEATVRSIIASQASREDRLRAADIIVCNVDRSLAELALTVAQILPRFGLSCPQQLA
jgi:dephospho-CoA kinase